MVFKLLRKAGSFWNYEHPVFSIIFMKISTMKLVLIAILSLFFLFCSQRHKHRIMSRTLLI